MTLAKLEVAIELCNLLLALAGHLGDEEKGGDGEEEAGEGVEEEDEDAAHRGEHRLEEEGDQEPDDGADKDGQRDDLVSDLRRENHKSVKKKESWNLHQIREVWKMSVENIGKQTKDR